MATLTKEQVKQKIQQLKQLTEEVNALTKELVEAGAMELSEEDLANVVGGAEYPVYEVVGTVWGRPGGDCRQVIRKMKTIPGSDHPSPDPIQIIPPAKK